MKKICIYILILLMVPDGSLPDQLVKLPVFFLHYQEHKLRDASIDLIDFLSMHYWGEDLNDQDDDRDMQLPFKKIDSHSQQVLFVPSVRIAHQKDYVFVLPRNESVYKSQYYPDPSLPAPFRPPCA
ncbi:hypothetical protein QNI16_35970 [Cytophagaceae bacterium YF14B1]|uniref:Uncharacterized protein n=1 Tax=Xanthocytophaga flava TaxID=3048013 RepID=A0AAE3R071_9BACT|nr:hypothetical protein [Xanthocytophaga flavus]MDJ1485934.1 hypothetical protein [Xanthocytophaga flavus]